MRIWNDKRVLITGVCGTIGSNLKDQILADPNNQVKELVCIDNNENELFTAAQNDKRKNVRYCLSDIRSYDDIKALMEGIDIVLHVAALKHVFFGEQNPDQYLLTNIVGTQNIIKAAKANKVERVLYTSSDKAVNPTNVMGASKLMGERLITAANTNNRGGRTIFSSTRFGNVLGSNGSVVPVFKEQILSGGPLTMTESRMTRFVMSIDEACFLVLKSVDKMVGGEIFVSKMPVLKIIDLAKAMIDIIAPLHKQTDIKISEIGARAGEKMYEELINSEESGRCMELKDYFVILPSALDKNDAAYEDVMDGHAPREYNSSSIPSLTQHQIATMLKKQNIL